MMTKSIAIVTIAVAGSAASALNFQVSEFSGPLAGGNLLGDPTGDAFTYVAGVGGAGGFGISIPGAIDAVAGATTEIGTDLTGGTVSVESIVVDNGGGNFDVTMRMFTTGTDLSPGGFTVGGFPADVAGVFMGANAGGNPFEFSDVALTNSASIELIGAGGSLAGPFDISGFSNFSAGVGGGWDGSFGVSFGAGSAGGGITEYLFQGNFTVIPSPGALAVAGLGGLVAARRRR